jgi:GntR family trehalose operon transcriptional repressor
MARIAYDHIYRDLKQEIEDGTYSYGQLLPSQSQLVKRFQCAHNTVRKAIGLLASQGYCLPIHGKGVRVIWRPREDKGTYGYALGDIETFVSSAQRNGVNAETQVCAFETCIADTALAELTGFCLGTELLYVERIRHLDGQALIRDRSFYRLSSVGDATPEHARQSMYAYVEGELGLKLASRKRTICMARATEEDRACLDIDGCDYLAVVRCQTYDSDATLFEFSESHYHPDYFRFHDTIVKKR